MSETADRRAAGRYRYLRRRVLERDAFDRILRSGHIIHPRDADAARRELLLRDLFGWIRKPKMTGRIHPVSREFVAANRGREPWDVWEEWSRAHG